MLLLYCRDVITKCNHYSSESHANEVAAIIYINLYYLQQLPQEEPRSNVGLDTAGISVLSAYPAAVPERPHAVHAAEPPSYDNDSRKRR